MYYAIGGQPNSGKTQVAIMLSEKIGIPYVPFDIQNHDVWKQMKIFSHEEKDTSDLIKSQTSLFRSYQDMIFETEEPFITDVSPYDFISYILMNGAGHNDLYLLNNSIEASTKNITVPFIITVDDGDMITRKWDAINIGLMYSNFNFPENIVPGELFQTEEKVNYISYMMKVISAESQFL